MTANSSIANYIVDISKDSQGNIWFVTIYKGVAKYDGDNLTYFTTNDGLPDNAVVDIEEDTKGRLWPATHSGLAIFDVSVFNTYSERYGLPHFRVSNIKIDNKGTIWEGTWGGVCRFEENGFKEFHVPKPDVKWLEYQDTQEWVTEITEDRKGNIWFGRDGYGSARYDGGHFMHFTKKMDYHLTAFTLFPKIWRETFDLAQGYPNGITRIQTNKKDLAV